MRLQNSSFLRRFLQAADGQSTQTQTNRSHNVPAQYRKLLNTSLFGTGVGLHSLARLVGAVRVVGGQSRFHGRRFWDSTKRLDSLCPVTELKASEALCAVHVRFSAAWK